MEAGGPNSLTPEMEMLAALYRAFEGLTRSRRAACGPGCHACCTGRATLTTLEGIWLLRGLRRAGREDLAKRAVASPRDQALRPVVTFNARARLCLARQEPPAEPEPAGSGGVCPLLVEGRCAAYDHRPLACRAMASREACRPGGRALQAPFWVTLNIAFYQIVEHASLGGGFGLLPDVLAAGEQGRGPGLLACEPLPGLPAPPEHQGRLQAALGQVFRLRLRGGTLGAALDDLRARHGR